MAWWVVAGHALDLAGGSKLYFDPGIARWVGRGALAVQVFMIVSGFVIAHLLISRKEAFGPYILRRWFRLVPLFVVTAGLAVITRDLYTVTFIDNPWARGAAMRTERLALEQEFWLPHLLAHATLLHGLIPQGVLKYSSSTFLAPAWSLSLEWQFYLLAPLLLWSLTKPKAAWFAVLVVALSILALNGFLGHWQYQSFLLIALPFFFGGITSRLMLEGKIPWLAAGLTVLATAVYVQGLGIKEVKPLLVVACIWSVFFFITARESGLFIAKSALLDKLSWLIALNPVSVALGRISYSTYLAHIPIFSIVIGLGLSFAGGTDRETVIAFTLAAVVLTVPASFALYRFVEQPGIRLGSHWVRRRPVDELASA